ncbi:hypothetical protein JCM10295v2_003666 [Rhodotorula toruloides]
MVAVRAGSDPLAEISKRLLRHIALQRLGARAVPAIVLQPRPSQLTDSLDPVIPSPVIDQVPLRLCRTTLHRIRELELSDWTTLHRIRELELSDWSLWLDEPARAAA